MIISITGFMGCGKSSVGKRLSELLYWHFADLDTLIEDAVGRSVQDIFATEGEAGFRRLEKQILKEILETSENMVLALGGGAVMTEESADLVRSKTTCVYLKASVETLLAHLESESAKRPLLASTDLKARIELLMSQRSTTYGRVAELIVETDGKSIESIAAEIVSALKSDSSSQSSYTSSNI